MYKAVGTALTPSGGALSGASVYVYLAGTTTLATIYSDNGVTTKTNPVTTDAQGAWSFYVADGRYDLSIQKTGYTTVAVTDQLYEDPVDASVINASILTATTATIGTLNATTVTLANAFIPTLSSTTATIGTLNAATATLTSATIPTLTSTTGTITTLNAPTANITNGLVSTSLAVGASAQTAANITNRKNLTGATTVWGVLTDAQIQSDATGSVRLNATNLNTAAASFTISNAQHYRAEQGTIGAGSSLSDQRGFFAHSSLVGATVNYGFYGDIAAASGRYNCYMPGTADNYFAGSTGFGALPVSNYKILLSGNLTGGATHYAIASQGTIQSDVTSNSFGYRSAPNTQATSFTLTNLFHFGAEQGTIGAGSTVTNQYGFLASASLVGGTNNYGFYAAIPSGANRWNFYATGTALNHFNGRSLFGTTTDDGTNQIQSAGHIATTVAGQGFKVKEGANAKMGIATLVAGTVTVSNTSVTANSRIFLTSNVDGGTPGFLRVSATVVGTSFTITSSSGTDTSKVAWEIREPA